MPKIAVAQYEIEQLPQWDAYEDKIVRLVEQATNLGAQLLLMSEFAGLELASWSEKESLEEQLVYLQSQLEPYHQLYQNLSKQYQIYLQPGTIPVAVEDGSYRNRAYLFAPNGKIGFQDKVFLTHFEQFSGLFSAGEELHCFHTHLGSLGINISYDIEFPLLAQALTESGAQLILVPAYTGKISGLTRVSITARARAIENQCFVAQSSLIGKASWCDFIDMCAGQSGIYCPADLAFMEDGILKQAPLNAPILVDAMLDLSRIEHVRTQGETLNFRDLQNEIDCVLVDTTL